MLVIVIVVVLMFTYIGILFTEHASGQAQPTALGSRPYSSAMLNQLNNESPRVNEFVDSFRTLRIKCARIAAMPARGCPTRTYCRIKFTSTTPSHSRRATATSVDVAA